MEKNHESSFCGKICKAFSNTCPLKKTRRVSYQYQKPLFRTTHQNAQATKQEAGMSTLPLPLPARNDPDHNKDYRRSGTELNSRISNYINRVGKKIRTTTFVGHDHAAGQVDNVDGKDKRSHIDERANDYINRAKRKIRATTSSFGMGKHVNFKSNDKTG